MTNVILALHNLLNTSRKRRNRIDQKGDAASAMNSSSRNNGSSGNGNGNGQANGDVEPDANALLPRYLFPLVRHYHDDFYVSRSFEPRLIVQLMAEGFLPIATSGYLLPKLHIERCVLQLNPESKLHISKSTRKKAKRFMFSVNECFDEVVAGCHNQHGVNWLYPPIVAAFKAIHEGTKGANAGGVNAMIMSANTFSPQDVTPVRLYSVEIWNAETGDLAGGELGYSVGGIYSSLTGFSCEDAAGSVQLVALGMLLTKCGFEYWDLGMDLEYKQRLGAEIIRRAEFVSKVKRSRVESKGIVLQCGGERKNAKELVDWGRPGIESMSVDTKKNGKKKSKKVKAKKGGNKQPKSEEDTEKPNKGKAKKEGDGQPQSDGELAKQPDRKRPHKEENGG